MRLLILFSILLSAIHSHSQGTIDNLSSSSSIELAQHFRNEGKLDSALLFAQKALDQYSNRADLLDSQVVAGLIITTVLNRKGENERALSTVLDIIPKAAETSNDSLHAISCGHAGIIYNHLFMNRDARVMFRKSYELFIEFDTLKAYQQLSNLSLLKARDPNTVQEALSDQQKIYRYQLRRNVPDDLAITLINLGVIHTNLKQFDSAIFYLKKTISMSSSIKMSSVENANYYLSMALIDDDQPRAALPFALRCHELSIATGIPTKIAYSSQLLSDVYERLQQYEEALRFSHHADSLLGQSFHETYSRRISELKVKYEAEQKQREIEKLNYERALAEQERTIYFILFMLVCLILVILFSYFKRKYRKQNLVIRSQKIEKAHVEKELEYKKNEFASHSLDLIQKDGLLKDIKESIQEVRENGNISADTSEALRHLLIKLDFNLNIEKNWEDFKIHFEQIHGDFSEGLSRRYPQLSSNELRLCSLIKIGLSVKEIATLLNISPQGVKTARYRLRKKLGLQTEDKLLTFLHAIEVDVMEISS